MSFAGGGGLGRVQDEGRNLVKRSRSGERARSREGVLDNDHNNNAQMSPLAYNLVQAKIVPCTLLPNGSTDHTEIHLVCVLDTRNLKINWKWKDSSGGQDIRLFHLSLALPESLTRNATRIEI